MTNPVSGITSRCVLPTSSLFYSSTAHLRPGIWSFRTPRGYSHIRSAAFSCDSSRDRGLLPSFHASILLFPPESSRAGFWISSPGPCFLNDICLISLFPRFWPRNLDVGPPLLGRLSADSAAPAGTQSVLYRGGAELSAAIRDRGLLPAMRLFLGSPRGRQPAHLPN